MSALLTPRMRLAAPPAAQRRAPRSSGQRALVAVAAVTAAGGVLVAGLGGEPVRGVLGLVLLLGVPTLLVATKVRWRVACGTERLVYSAGVVLLGVLLAGLVLNTALPVVGISRPLALLPLACAAWAVNVGLLLWRREVRLPRVYPRSMGWLCQPLRRHQLPVAAAVAAVLLACAGAIRLNNGAGGLVAVLGLATVVVAAAGQLLRSSASAGSDSWLLFLCGTALLLGTSLRGWYIIGHDIQREYFVFILARQAERWQFDAFPDPYNACLSVSLLPAVLAGVTGLSGLVLFKVGLQLLFAILPVLTYLYSRRLVGRRLGLVSAGFVIAFPTFFTDMPFMVRQEVAFWFLGLLVLAATQPGWSVRRRAALATAFGFGMVLSHYSTTYIIVATLVLGLALRSLLRLRARWTGTDGAEPGSQAWARRGREAAVLLSVPVIISLLAMSWLWTGPATHSGGHLGEVLRSSVQTMVHGDPGSDSADLRYSLFSGAPEPPQDKLDRFASEAYAASAVERAGGELLPVTPSQRQPTIVEQSTVEPTSLGQWFERLGGDPEAVHELSRKSVAVLLQIFMLVGASAVLLRRGPTRRFSSELRLVTLATLAALGAQVLLPGISAEYGVLRAFQHSLLVLAPVVTIGCLLVLRALGRRAIDGVVAVLVAVWGVTTGLSSQLVGGYPAQLNVADTGPYYDLYYTTDQEVRGIRWLDHVLDADTVQSEVVTDRYSVRRMAVFRRTYSGTNDEFFPSQLRHDSYVFVGTDTLERGAATVFYGGDLLTYSYPLGVLGEHKNLVFDAGGARVYR